MKKKRIKIGRRIDDNTSEAIIDREDGVFAGTIAVAREGQPILDGQELIAIDNECQSGWHDIETLYSSRPEGGEGAAPSPSSGPAQVATPAYRDGYDRIFGKRREVGLA